MVFESAKAPSLIEQRDRAVAEMQRLKGENFELLKTKAALEEACAFLRERDEKRGCVKLERDHHRETLREVLRRFRWPNTSGQEQRDMAIGVLGDREPWLFEDDPPPFCRSKYDLS